jgi:tripartite-type tricarboxylate transporter receptor subunit TctC
LKDLPAAAATPGYTFGSGGPGSIGHIVGEMAKGAMKIQMTHVPYRGGAPMTTDLIAGQIPVGIDVITAFVPMVKSGQIRALAVTTKERSALLPDVPSVVEAGWPQLVAENYFGVSAPAGLPADVATKLSQALGAIVDDPVVRKRFEELGVTPTKMTSADFTAFVERQVQAWSPVVKAADIKP